jgi:hypothetical protein
VLPTTYISHSYILHYINNGTNNFPYLPGAIGMNGIRWRVGDMALIKFYVILQEKIIFNLNF